MLKNTAIVILLLFYLHGIGLWLFIRGFLLSRLSLSLVTTCDPLEECTLPPTHKRAVLLIIDALRFDFISPNVPNDASPHYHNVLTLPAELTAEHPQHSFIFNSYSDPPTTTLQRIKGITTGSLPTFVEMGSNFGANEIEEDSIIRQLRRQGKKIAFMGDDTWMLVFPKSFQPNMTHPFDSFNVEDLHTVDNGVIANLFPLLKSPREDWDFIIGHFLGVDHVGHRLGPDHPTMRTKLKQMDDVLRDVVDLLDDETLLVLLGDHGMDRRGDHGGDGIHETSSALWIYSKLVPLSSMPDIALKNSLITHIPFPGIPTPHRSVQQIDIVPTLSLLLGLPIPFNNLGSPIPELFSRSSTNQREGSVLERALRFTAEQIKAYLAAYRGSVSGGELDPYWKELEGLYSRVLEATGGDPTFRMETLISYSRRALSACRELWAQFDSLAMVLGLIVLGASVLCTVSLYLSDVLFDEDRMARMNKRAGLIACTGPLLGVVGAGVITGNFVPSLVFSLFITALFVSGTIVLFSAPHAIPKPPLSIILASLHCISFFSNSFVFWEDRIVPYLLASSLALQLPNAIPTSPQFSSSASLNLKMTRLHRRILGYTVLALLCVRLIGLSTVCREEQQPYCHVTFYASSSLASPPLLMILLILPTAFLLPPLIRQFLSISKSNSGPAAPFLNILFRGALLGGSICWILEYAESSSLLGEDSNPYLRVVRTVLARFVFGGGVLVGYYTWTRSSLCLEVVPAVSQGDPKKVQVQIMGFANALGSSYLLFGMIFFALVWVCSQVTAQVVLALGALCLLSWLEVVDSTRDLRKNDLIIRATLDPRFRENELERELASVDKIRFMDVLPICLLGLELFYGTGHQSTLQSIQWKTAFLLTETVVYPFSPLLVMINNFGPITLMAVFLPLLAAWNVTPTKPYAEKLKSVERESLRASLAGIAYFGCLLLGSAASAAWLRRHLMVWKVFAPRFMAAAAGLVAFDLGVALGLLWGVPGVFRKVEAFAKVSKML